MTTFYANYIELCAKKKKSASAVATEIGLSRTSPNGWKNGKIPSDINLIKLADYFGVTVEELTTENKKSPTPEGMELSNNEILEAYYRADEVTQELIRRALGLQ